MLKFVVGLTDVIDYEGFIYNESNDTTDTGAYYNIRRASTEIEKASMEWEINTNISAARNSILLWEKTIRIPHLCMIGIHAHEYKFYPEFKQYDFSISFINLLPINPDLITTFTDDDYSHCNGDPEFGDLCIRMVENVNDPDMFDSDIISAFTANDISKLADASNRGSVLPKYSVNFPLRGNAKSQSWIKRPDFAKFVNDNKDVIESKGYDINSNRISNYGPITIGKLLTGPDETYSNLTKYPRICRTSFMQTTN
jgi:hypothetical protein